MKKIAIIGFQLLFLIGNLCAQGVNNNWLLGYTGGGGQMRINFDSLPASPHQIPIKMNFYEAEANISDKAGNLLFYTNGIFIADATNDTMQNGSGISRGSFGNNFVNDGIPVAQAAIVLPKPGDTSIYYLIYQTFTSQISGYWQPPGLFYCTINMTQNGGLGAVVQKKISLVQDILIASELTACKHANGRDWWIITHAYNSDLYYKFLLTPTGILGPYTQNIGTQMYVRGLSQSCFSPDGKKFACYHPLEDLDIMDFDRCSGMFSNYMHVPFNDSAAGGGVAFSPNSQMLYVSSTKYVYQFNMADTNVIGSQLKIATWDGFYSPFSPFATTFYLSQLAPDGKIYINSTNGVQHIHVINQPDSLGLACNLMQHSLTLPAFNAFTIPNHPNYFLGADSASLCDTLQLGFKVTLTSSTKEKISIFPNPARNLAQLSYTPSSKVRTMYILDVNGKIILRVGIPQWSQKHQIDVSSLNAGMYLCRFVDGMESTAKFAVERQ